MKRSLPVFTLLLCLGVIAQAQTPTITYTLGMSQPWTHYYEVEVTFSGLPSQKTLDVNMPAWRTGRYVIFDFSGGVQEFSAVDARGSSLEWIKIDKDTWHIQTNGSKTVTARYKVFADEFSQRTRGLDDQGGFVDGTSVFMYVDQYRQVPVTLKVKPYKNWHVTTGLERVKEGSNDFTSPSYDYLVDCPLFIGTQKDFDFEAGGKPHTLSVYGDGNYDSGKIIKDLKKIVELNKEFWGDLPYKRYVFLLQLSPNGGGGTEHINSTAMGTRPFIFQNPGSYRGFLGLVSHEYFHTWNVKQIRPHGISPYDWSKENYTRELWIAEGTTSYYGGLLLERAGYSTAASYVRGLAGQIRGNRMRPGNRIQPVSESSFDAWVKYWKGNRNSYNAESDYYDVGSDASMLIDLEIRNRSKNKHSLDDVMRAMYKRFPWNGSGYTVDDFRKVCEEFAGGSFKQFFDDFIFGTKPLQWEKALAYAGLDVTATEDSKPYLGVAAYDRGDRTSFYRVVAGSPAYNAGLNANDELIALNGYRVRSSELNDRIGEMKPGDVVTVTVMRDGMLREFKVTLASNPVPEYTVTKTKNPTSLQKAIYESWLKTTWDEKDGM